MKRFLEVNPGLPSRFPRIVEFEDYSSEELAEIYRRFVQQSGRTLAADAESRLMTLVDELYNSRDRTFGNGRAMRNIFEHTLELQGTRLAQLDLTSCSDEQLHEIIAEDIAQ
jgi:stage V sporulation protein K